MMAVGTEVFTTEPQNYRPEFQRAFYNLFEKISQQECYCKMPETVDQCPYEHLEVVLPDGVDSIVEIVEEEANPLLRTVGDKKFKFVIDRSKAAVQNLKFRASFEHVEKAQDFNLQITVGSGNLQSELIDDMYIQEHFEMYGMNPDWFDELSQNGNEPDD